MTYEERQAVYEAANGFCVYCGKKLKHNWHVDHAMPKSRFQDTVLVASCPRCNMTKGVRTPEEFRRHLTEMRDDRLIDLWAIVDDVGRFMTIRDENNLEVAIQAAIDVTRSAKVEFFSERISRMRAGADFVD